MAPSASSASSNRRPDDCPSFYSAHSSAEYNYTIINLHN